MLKELIIHSRSPLMLWFSGFTFACFLVLLDKRYVKEAVPASHILGYLGLSIGLFAGGLWHTYWLWATLLVTFGILCALHIPYVVKKSINWGGIYNPAYFLGICAVLSWIGAYAVARNILG